MGLVLGLVPAWFRVGLGWAGLERVEGRFVRVEGWLLCGFRIKQGFRVSIWRVEALFRIGLVLG